MREMCTVTHQLKIVNTHSKILVFAFCKNLVVSLLKIHHLNSTEGVLKVNTSYDEEYLGIILKIRISSHQKKFF